MSENKHIKVRPTYEFNIELNKHYSALLLIKIFTKHKILFIQIKYKVKFNCE